MPEDVEIDVTPWVSGTRANAYYGPVSVESNFMGMNTLEVEINKALTKLRAETSNLGGNWVVGFEMSIDPFNSTGIVLRLVGTAAHLVPLFD